MSTLASMERDKENGWVLRRTMEVSWWVGSRPVFRKPGWVLHHVSRLLKRGNMKSHMWI